MKRDPVVPVASAVRVVVAVGLTGQQQFMKKDCCAAISCALRRVFVGLALLWVVFYCFLVVSHVVNSPSGVTKRCKGVLVGCILWGTPVPA